MKEKNKKKTVKEQDLFKALVKKALGYDATEVVEEYAQGEEGEVKLTKRKVTKKNVPPDMTALKILLDESPNEIEQMTDEQLEEELKRLINLLNEGQN